MRLTQMPEWQALARHATQMKRRHLRRLFDQDPQRFHRYSLEAAGIFADWSKQRITDETCALLLTLAEKRGAKTAIRDMFAGVPINGTEHRPVLHTALRHPDRQGLMVAQTDVLTQVHAVLDRMEAFVGRLHNGQWQGYSGRRITDVVNIGIGGSDLGPMMVTEALKPYAIGTIQSHFVSNIDGAHLGDLLERLNPETTLFIIVSKTFTTQETLTNAESARQWFLAHGGTRQTIARHFVAVSTHHEAVVAFGIDPANMFGFWDWVGGRYSLWSAVGLSIACTIGMAHFRALLHGAHSMDRHFQTAPLAANLPVMLGLIGIWNRNFLGYTTHAILPYDQHLYRLPAYLQQLDMESNGKSVTMQGDAVACDTGPVIWGAPGTNGQHAFYQLIHQGSQIVPADFIAAIEPSRPLGRHHAMLLANFLAQPEALMRGKTLAEAKRELRQRGLSKAETDRLAPHRVFKGGRPSTSLLVQRMTPEALGALIALYEHKVFIQGLIWGINSFDQWGVELGKELAGRLLPELEGAAIGQHDASTAGLLARIRKG